MEIKLRAGMEESALLKFHNNRLEKKVKALQEKMAQVHITLSFIEREIEESTKKNKGALVRVVVEGV